VDLRKKLVYVSFTHTISLSLSLVVNLFVLTSHMSSSAAASICS